MNALFSLITASVLAVTTTTPAMADKFLDEHNILWRAIEMANVPVYVNNKTLCKAWGGGGYFTNETKGIAAISICQDMGSKAKEEGSQVVWTLNDFDTLRHEAVHLIQDCKAGVKADGKSENVLSPPILAEFIKNAMSEGKVKRIRHNYRNVSPEDLQLELEAWAVSEVMDARSIAKGVMAACHVKTSA